MTNQQDNTKNKIMIPTADDFRKKLNEPMMRLSKTSMLEIHTMYSKLL